MSDLLNLIAGQGTDDIQLDGLPLVKILQKGSPQCDETHEKYKEKGIANSRTGDFVLTSKNVIVGTRDKGFDFVPLAITSVYSEFQDKKFKGNHPMSIVTHPKYQKGGRDPKKPNKEYLGASDLDHTIFVAGIAYAADGTEHKVLIPFTSTALKDARILQKQLATFTDEQYVVNGKPVRTPIFARAWKIKTIAQKNEQGSWYAFDITPLKTFSLKDDEALLRGFSSLSVEAVAMLPKPGPAAEAPRLTNDANGPVVDVGDEDAAF